MHKVQGSVQKGFVALEFLFFRARARACVCVCMCVRARACELWKSLWYFLFRFCHFVRASMFQSIFMCARKALCVLSLRFKNAFLPQSSVVLSSTHFMSLVLLSPWQRMFCWCFTFGSFYHGQMNFPTVSIKQYCKRAISQLSSSSPPPPPPPLLF